MRLQVAQGIEGDILCKIIISKIMEKIKILDKDEAINENVDVQKLREELEREKQNASYWYDRYAKLLKQYEQHVNALQYVVERMKENI